MAEIRSKAPLPLTMYKIESEVFSSRTKEHGVAGLHEVVKALAILVFQPDKESRDRAAVQLAATCVRIIEEVKE